MIKEIIASTRELTDTLVQDRRYLHEGAEVGFNLEKTRAYIENRLKELGLLPKRIGKCGVYAVIGDTSKPAVLLRADIDALPIKEKTELEYKAENGNMHACGHDMHAAMLLSAAKILMQYVDRLNCCVKLLFQPAEEQLLGAIDCKKHGILKNPDVKYAFMLHVLTALPFPCGAVIVSSGGVTAPAATFFKVEVKGKSAHGAAPDCGTDAIRISSEIANTLYNSAESKDRDFLLSIGKINGGIAPNVISDLCTVEGTFRAFEEEKIARLKRFIEDVARKTATSYKGEAKVIYTADCPALFNDSSLSEKVYENLRGSIDAVYTSDELSGGERRICGSEDFAHFSRAVPSLMIGLCAGDSNEGYNTPLHNPKTLFDERALPIGAGVYAALPFCI